MDTRWIARQKGWIVLLLMAALSVPVLGHAEAAGDEKAIGALIERWDEAYGVEINIVFGKEIPEGDVSREEALRYAVWVLLTLEKVDLKALEGYRLAVDFYHDPLNRNWLFGFESLDGNGAFKVRVSAETGELMDFEQLSGTLVNG